MKKLLILILVLTFLISACGPEPEPTMSAEEVQGTAVAAAMAMVAETQAAIPTATPIPPTETPSPTSPVPTNTTAALVVPTQAVQTVPTVAQGQPTPADICLDLKHVLPADAAGPKTTIRIVNEHNVPVTVSLYLNKTDFGECGYRSYALKKNGDTVQTLPQGCYSAWAWSQDSKDAFNSSGFGLCSNNTDKWTIVIRGEQIIMLAP